MGAERAAQIAEMESMGFERTQIELAMRAAFFNSERAIEYLLTVSLQFLLCSTRTNQFRAFQRTSNRRLDLPLRPKLPLLRLLRALTRSTCSRQQPMLVRVDVVVVLRVVRGLVAIHLEQLQQLEELRLVDWEISTFCETTHSSNNSDRLYNKTLKCSSQSCSKSAPETRN